MKRGRLLQSAMWVTTPVLVAVMLLAFATISNGAEEKQDDRWRFAITPYIWLPSISGTMKIDTPPGFLSGNVDTDSGGILGDLQFAGMIDLQAQKGKWSLLADIMYVDFSDDQTAYFPGVLPGSSGWTTASSWDLKALVAEFVGGYSVFQDENMNFDLLGGVRYARIDGDVSLNIAGPLPAWVRSRTFSESENFIDPIVGFKGRYDLTKKWYIPYYFDIGGFSVDSDLTLQAFAGIGYHFTDLFSMVLGYRYLYYDFGDSDLVEDVNLYGATLGFSFTF